MISCHRNFTHGYKYNKLEADALMEVLESISCMVSPQGGFTCKTSSYYSTKGDIQITEEQITSGKEKDMAMSRAAET